MAPVFLLRRKQEIVTFLTLHRHLPCDARLGSRPSEVKDVREIPRIRTICEILGALHDALMYTAQTDMVQIAGAVANEVFTVLTIPHSLTFLNARATGTLGRADADQLV